MSDTRTPMAATGPVRRWADDAVPAYSRAPQPAPVPANGRTQTPLEQMFAYYEAA